MSNLVKNEIIKILKKIGIYIMLITILAYIILANALSKYVDNETYITDEYNEEYISTLRSTMQSLDTNLNSNLELYVHDKTTVDTYELLKKYDKNSWQYAIIKDKGTEYISQINQCKYILKNENELKVAQNQCDEFIKKLDKNNWKLFAKEDLARLKQAKAENQTEINKEDKLQDIQIEGLEMRLKYNIEYGNNYKNEALSNYTQNSLMLADLEENNNKTYEEKQQYQTAKAEQAKNKYVIEKDIDIYSKSNLRAMLLKLFSDYSEYDLFIVIMVVLIAGAIVSEEFNKGTIKLLLVRPYKRSKILLAKFITVLITIFATMIIVCALQFIVGGIFFGFDSLNIPAIEYDYGSGQIIEMSIFKNLIMRALGKLPIYILLGTLAFSLSTLFTNTAVAISITLLGYMGSDIINELGYAFKLKWLKFFVTPNWDFTQFYFGKLPQMEGITVSFSAAICLVYFIIMLTYSFLIFKNRNIKNV